MCVLLNIAQSFITFLYAFLMTSAGVSGSIISTWVERVGEEEEGEEGEGKGGNKGRRGEREKGKGERGEKGRGRKRWEGKRQKRGGRMGERKFLLDQHFRQIR